MTENLLGSMYLFIWNISNFLKNRNEEVKGQRENENLPKTAKLVYGRTGTWT